MAPETPSLKSDTEEEAEDDDAFEGGACKKLVEDLALLEAADLFAMPHEDAVGADDAAAADDDDDNDAGTAENVFAARRDAFVVIAVAEAML